MVALVRQVLQFFATPAEVAGALRLADAELKGFLQTPAGLVEVDVRGEWSVHEQADIDPSVHSRRLFLGPGKAADAGDMPDLVRMPGKYGFVHVDLPVVTDGSLYMSVLAAMGGWMDSRSHHPSNQPLGTFRSLRDLLRPVMVAGATAVNERRGATQHVPAIGVSAGAWSLHASGVVLRQEGVLNLRYLPHSGDGEDE